MVSPLPPEEFGQDPAELPACRHLPQNKPKGFAATQTTVGSCKTRWVGEPAWLNEASTGGKNALTAISLQEGCEPRFCVLRSLGTAGMVSCHCPSGSTGGGRRWPCSSIQMRFRRPAGAKLEAPKSQKVKKMRHSKQISCQLSSAAMDLGTWVKFRCLHPISAGSITFGTAPKSLPMLTGNVIFFSLHVVEVYTKKTSPWIEWVLFHQRARRHLSILCSSIYLRSGSTKIIRDPTVMGSVAQRGEEVPGPKSTHHCTQQRRHCCYS